MNIVAIRDPMKAAMISVADETCSPFCMNRIMAMATTILAPDEIPRTYGPAIGFSKNVCSKNPASANAPPRSMEAMILGRRIVQMISRTLSGPSRRNMALAMSPMPMCTLPELMLTTIVTANATIMTAKTITHRVRRRKFASW